MIENVLSGFFPEWRTKNNRPKEAHLQAGTRRISGTRETWEHLCEESTGGSMLCGWKQPWGSLSHQQWHLTIGRGNRKQNCLASMNSHNYLFNFFLSAQCWMKRHLTVMKVSFLSQTYPVAVVVLDPEVIPDWASKRALPADMQELCNNAKAKQEILKDMNRVGKESGLKGFEFVSVLINSLRNKNTPLLRNIQPLMQLWSLFTFVCRWRMFCCIQNRSPLRTTCWRQRSSWSVQRSGKLLKRRWRHYTRKDLWH